MATDNPLLVRQKLLAAKVETTTGTAESLTTAEATFNVFDPKYATEIPYVERRGQSATSRLPGVPGERKGTITFDIEVYGKGSSGVPSWGIFLEACGMLLTSQTYTPATGSSSAKNLTMGFYQDGWFKSIVGAAGNFTIKGEAGKPARATFTMQGVHQAPTAVAILAPTYDTVIPPRFAGVTFTIGGTAFKIKDFELECGNVIAMRPTPATAGGLFAACVTDRYIKFKCAPETLALGTKDWYADHLAGTTAALVLAIGTATNNILTINAPAMQLINAPQDGDRDGVLTSELEFACVRSVAAGDDELSLVFT